MILRSMAQGGVSDPMSPTYSTKHIHTCVTVLIYYSSTRQAGLSRGAHIGNYDLRTTYISAAKLGQSKNTTST